ncbi:MAG TPA: PKD domain-containing protein [Bacteroidia bacterium]|nr:PKD domain-containing protein [Bacteroidia bacterium]
MNRLSVKSFYSFFLLFLILGCAQQSSASHSMGSDLTYRCLGGNSYEITLSFYRDCAGIDADSTALIHFESSCFGDDTLTIYLIPGTGQEISPICRNDTTTCNGGEFTGIQEYIYQGIVNLPGPCADWRFSYNLCCRNWAITNIDRPGNTLMYIYATLNNTITPCNNSPIFSNKPVPFACLGQQFCYNHGGFDIDGDSLVYSMITPYDSAGLSVNYLPPFTATSPLSSNPAVSFNPQTGDICMTPTNMEVTVMAVLVQEYRNGVLIGSVERDIQVTVITCSNILPTLGGINGTNSFSMTVCAGSQTCFTIYSADGDSPQNTYVSWDYSIPGGTLTTLPGQHESASFCWTPTQADISPNPHCFTAIVTDDNCPYSGNQIYSYCITVAGLDADAGPDITIGCNASATLTASATGGSGIYSYQWNSGQTTSSITTGPGMYVVTVSGGSCSNSDTAMVNPAAGVPVADFTTNFSCSSLAVQFTNLSSITGGTITNYSWNFGDGGTSVLQNPTHTFATTGNYTVRLIVQSAGGCIDTVSQTLHLSLNHPTAAFTPSNACVNAQLNFTDLSSSASTLADWKWYFGDGATSSIQNPAHVYSAAGNYTVSLVVQNSDGCMDSIAHPVTISGLPSPNAGVDQTICNGAYATLTGVGGVSFNWFPGNATTATITVNPGSTQPYIYTATNIFGCQSTDTVVVFVRRGPNLNTSPDRTICRGDSTNISANSFGQVTYSWSPGGATTSQITVHPGVTTNYIITATDTGGCHSWDTVRVQVNPLPLANAGLDQTICTGDTATLAGSGGNSYSWDPGNLNSQQISVNPVATTIYTLSVTDTNNCSAIDRVWVIVKPLPIANAGPDLAMCLLDSVTLNASGGVVYSWTPGGDSIQQVIVSPSANTIYTVEVTDAFGCSDTDLVQVRVYNLPIVNAGADNSICFGTSDTLRASSGPFIYSWYPGGASAQLVAVTPDSSTNYIVSVTDTNGCHASDTTRITVFPLPVVDAGPDLYVCFGQQDTLEASGGMQYLWSPGGSTAQQLIVAPDSNEVFFVTVTDSNTCVSTDSVHVFADSLLMTSTISSPALCKDSAQGFVSVIASGGTTPYQYVWSPGAYATNEVFNLPAGVYTVAVTDSFGCVQTDSIRISEPPQLVLNCSGPLTKCIGQESILFAAATGGTPPYVLSWSTGDHSDSLTVAPDITTLYTVSVVDSNNCALTPDSVIVTVYPALSVFADIIPEICFGESASLSALAGGGNGGPYQYAWNDSSVFTAEVTVHPDRDSTFIVTVSDGCSPMVNDTVSIVVHPLPLVDFLPHQIQGCMPVTVDFQNYFPQPAGAIYSWDLDDDSFSTDPGPSHVYENPGNYDVSLSIVSPEGCSDSITVENTVIVHGFPTAAFSQSGNVVSSYNPEIFFNDNSIDAAFWEWDFGDGSVPSFESGPSHVYPDTGAYLVRLIVTSHGGCTDTVYSTLRVEQEFALYVPNAFTPNKDGINEGFSAQGIGFVDYEMWIIDRWGVKIFHSESADIPWDGTFFGNGTLCQNDVYEYIIEVHDYKGKLHRLIGHVTLVR